MKKRCSQCGEVKHPNDFCSNKKWLSNVSWCKQCQAAAARRRFASLSADEKRAASARDAEYLKAHPWVRRAKGMNSRYRGKGRVSGAELKALWESHDGKCWICGFPAEQLDHVRPINDKAGGLHEAGNLRPICTECNHKRDRVWRGEDKANKEAVLLRQLKQMLHG